MPAADLNKARSRLIRATIHIRDGARLSRARVLAHYRDAPRLLEGTGHEVVDLTNAPTSDLDFYAYDLARLQDAAREVNKVFGQPQEIVDALTAYEAAIPGLRRARNPLTHPTNDSRLDDVAWFSALVKLKPDGSVEYLVDPRYDNHDAMEALAEALLSYLRAGLLGGAP